MFFVSLASGQRCCVVHVFAVVWLAVSCVSRCCGGVVGVLAIGIPREASSEWRGLALEFWCLGFFVYVTVASRASSGRGSRSRLRDGGASKENKLFFPVKGSKGLEGSKCLYAGRVLGHTRFPWESVQEKQAGNKGYMSWGLVWVGCRLEGTRGDERA
jgi:hypothetical protein